MLIKRFDNLYKIVSAGRDLFILEHWAPLPSGGYYRKDILGFGTFRECYDVLVSLGVLEARSA